jgi:hypothetical protein
MNIFIFIVGLALFIYLNHHYTGYKNLHGQFNNYIRRVQRLLTITGSTILNNLAKHHKRI